ncbi:uncharacterized protein LACBIDRAFT_331957 [Laccaria bicolor S238N-H82]|uniref:Predicted protein n=1 Tax=Laccaria bicolor (strain S238N-H82 / ATCC MYA-4686) TaxID=486041 RepID=B0DMZ3_LACBS|nr:uncharacterized protein LACBIDRAFT_331025 [Laccaria bicolor S238N-H82]XP_001886364.1 uncharacterized protein LACBIDRAFT_331957 [Laccaria bicolor S238N-H82]EDR02941.1 predicted protein [Laccaria bicolor S238N-H82]EDR04134.1 predicted protein [Laccaria bicolor S238N-H82]|eukprot:XP_001885389.1 predicted protein [Laccaria bicolor S238N-H82]
MYTSLFNSESFLAATLFIERLVQKEEHVCTLIKTCQDNPTLSLDLHLILEAVATEKHLEGKLGYKDENVLSLHHMVTTAIAAAIRPSSPLSLTISQYFEKFDGKIHAYGKKFPTSPHITAYHPYRCSPTPRCSKCKRLGHIRKIHKNCSDYQCGGCLWWGPGHTTPNCERMKEADKAWEWEKQMNPTGYDMKIGTQMWKERIYDWTGVPILRNEDWNTPRKQPEFVDLTSPLPPSSPAVLPLFPPTPPSSPLYNPYSPMTHPSPLFNLKDLVSDFDSITSSSGNISDIEV